MGHRAGRDGLVFRRPAPTAPLAPLRSLKSTRPNFPARFRNPSPMAWNWTPGRRDEPELMDVPGLPVAEVEDAYRVLQLVNKQLGNRRTIRREFLRFRREDAEASSEVTVLDVGSGSGDIPEAIRQMVPDRAIQVVALDRDATAVASARGRSLSVVQGDALRLPFADRTIDLVVAVKFAHHFHGPSLEYLLGEMARVARHRVLVLDIRRHWLAYWGFVAWSRVFTRNRLVRHDGPLSVLRGFTREELLDSTSKTLGFDWTVRSHAGFQLTLVGRRPKSSAD